MHAQEKRRECALIRKVKRVYTHKKSEKTVHSQEKRRDYTQTKKVKKVYAPKNGRRSTPKMKENSKKMQYAK